MTVIRKPTPIPALQFTGENADEIREMCKAKYQDVSVYGDGPLLCLDVNSYCTYASVGHWIVCDSGPHPMILDDDRFWEMYEEVK